MVFNKLGSRRCGTVLVILTAVLSIVLLGLLLDTSIGANELTTNAVHEPTYSLSERFVASLLPLLVFVSVFLGLVMFIVMKKPCDS